MIVTEVGATVEVEDVRDPRLIEVPEVITAEVAAVAEVKAIAGLKVGAQEVEVALQAKVLNKLAKVIRKARVVAGAGIRVQKNQ